MKYSNPKLFGSTLVFLGAIFWSLNAPLVKFIEIDPLLLCGGRSLVAGLVLAPFIRIHKLCWNRWMVLYLVSYTSLCLGVIISLTYTSATIAIGMQYSSVIYLFLLHWLQYKRPNMRAIPAVLLISIGVILFMSSDNSGGSSFGNMIAMTEGISFALMTLSAKKAGEGNPLGLTAVGNLACGLFIFTFLSPTYVDLIHMNELNLYVMLLLGVVQIGLGYSCYNCGLRFITPQRASILALWEMILGPVWVALLVHEYPTKQILLGFVIIILGIIVDSVVNKSTE